MQFLHPKEWPTKTRTLPHQVSLFLNLKLTGDERLGNEIIFVKLSFDMLSSLASAAVVQFRNVRQEKLSELQYFRTSQVT